MMIVDSRCFAWIDMYRTRSPTPDMIGLWDEDGNDDCHDWDDDEDDDNSNKGS